MLTTPMSANVMAGLATAGDHAADLAACKASLRHGSRTFLAASMLLPREVRDSACALYAFCRMADDAVDEAGALPALAVAGLRERLARIYAGAPQWTALDDPVERALAAVVRRHAVPRALLEALIEGFVWDAEARRYETLASVHDYAARVAGSVGAMMSLLMGVRDPEPLARACELGVAMQLSNIARDVGEDAAMGRLYLPRQWLREVGIDPDAWLAAPVFTPALGGVVERLLAEADRLYARVGAGVARLPLACRPGINAARFMYAEIGQQVRAAGLDSISRRAVVPGSRKLVLLARAVAALRPGSSVGGDAALGACSFLVDAVMREPASGSARAMAQARAHGRMAWVIDLFERLERQQQAQALSSPGRRASGASPATTVDGASVQARA